MSKVLSFGPLDARVMIVVEAPGEQEVREGRPLVGPVGQKLRGFLLEVGIDPDECRFANLCKYRPPGNKLEKFFLDGGHPNVQVLEGLAELADEINYIKPNVILALGNFPLKMLTGKGTWFDRLDKQGHRIRGFTGIQDWRGSLLRCTIADAKVLPTFHPAYIIREGMKDHGTFKTDLARLAAEMLSPELPWPNKEIVLVTDQPMRLTNYLGVIGDEEHPKWEPSDLTRYEIRDKLLSTPTVPTTLDIEYIGSKLLCVGLTNNRDEAFVLPTDSLGDLMYMQDIVRNTKGFNAQNSMFDASILEWHYSLPIMERVVFDTMLAANAANIELPKGLDYLVSVYTNQPYYKGMVNWTLIKKGLQPVSTVYAYNGIDVWTQHEVMEEQIKWEFGDPAVKRTFDFMMKMLLPLWNMSKRGVRMDLELLSRISTELQQDANAAALELMMLAGRSQPINVKSGKQIAELLFDQLGLKPGKKNRTGYATDDKTLASLAIKCKTPEQTRAIQLIRECRRARDLKSKFFNVEFDDDARMRGHYDPTKTVTGRLASRKFYPTGRGTNQQNIPRDKRARRAFIADRGKVFGYADLERAESFVVAHLTNDARMLADHAPGVDAHKSLASAIFEIPAEEVSDEQRYVGKQTRHAGNYMEGWMTFMTSVNKLADKTGVALDAPTAKFLIERYKALHPGLPKWWKRVEQDLWKSRTLFNLVGRKRIFYGHIGSIMPEAVAFTPQSTVGDVLNIGFLNTEGIPCDYAIEQGVFDPDHAAELRDCGYENLMQIHDALAFQCNERDLDRVARILRAAMQIPLRNPFTREPFTINVEVAVDIDPAHIASWKSNWGDVKKYEGDLIHA